MESMSAPTLAAIAIDTPCIHCGYNLRGLTAGGLCPECGKTIDESLRGDLLRFANPEWLRKVRLGIKLQLWAIMLSILLGIGAATIAIGLGFGFAGVQIIQIVPMIVMIGGTLALTTREPRESLQEEGISVRTLLRTSAFLLPTFQVVQMASELLPETLTLIVTILGFFLWPLHYALFLIFMRGFALRVPDDKLYRSSTRLVYVGSVLYGLYTALSAYLYLRYYIGANPVTISIAGSGSPTTLNILSAAVSILNLVVLVLFLWYVRVLTKYRRVLGEQLVLAEGVPL